MPVNQRGEAWQASVSHKGKRHRKDFVSKSEAKIWEAEMKAKLLKGIDLDEPEDENEQHSLQELLDKTAALRWRGTRGEKQALINAGFVVRILGADRLVSTLNRTDVITIREELLDMENSDATINRKLSAFSTMVREAVELKWLEKHFSPGLTKEATGRIRFFTEAEEKAMLDWSKQWAFDDLRDYIIVSIDTGFRQGEILKIRKRDVGQANLWTFWTKNGKNREVPLTARAREVLERRARDLPRQDDVVFDLKAKKLRYQWYKMAGGLGMIEDENYVPHTMRHTFVTRLLHRGADIKTVMELAGHNRIETTQRYAQTSPERKILAISRLETNENQNREVDVKSATEAA